MSTIRVVTWNLFAGTGAEGSKQEDTLNGIADRLIALNADIVLLNEVAIWPSGINQIQWIADRAGYNNTQRAITASIEFGLKGKYYVAVLSRFPQLSWERIEHSYYLFDGGAGYATIYVTIDINNRKHHIFSARFNHKDITENINSHEAIQNIIAAIPLNESVILGGDFNNDWNPDNPLFNYKEFINKTQLRHVLNPFNPPVEYVPNNKLIDHLLIRGPYRITHGRHEVYPISDHPLLYAEITLNDVELFSPITAIVPRNDEILLATIAKLDQANKFVYAHWSASSGWRGWTKLDVHCGLEKGLIDLVNESDRSYLLWIGEDGWVYFLIRTADGAWQQPWIVGNSPNEPFSGVPGGAIHGVSCEAGMLHVFYANPQGEIIYARQDNTIGGTWPEHSKLRGGVTLPGGHVNAVSCIAGQVDVFCVGTDGGVYTSSWKKGGHWAAWFRIGDVVLLPGSYISAVSRGLGKIDLFVVDIFGKVMSAATDPAQGWRGWWHIQSGMAKPSEIVTAVSRESDMLDIFTRGTDGLIYTAAWSPAEGWKGWWPINEARSTSSVWPVSRSSNKLDIFFTTPDGVTNTLAWPVNGNWGGPWAIAD